MEGPIANEAAQAEAGRAEARTLELHLGSTLASTARTWIRRLPVVSATSVLIHLPTVAWTAWHTVDRPVPAFRAWMLGIGLANLFLRPWLASGLAPSFSSEEGSTRPSLGRCGLDTLRGTFAALIVPLRVVGMSFAVFFFPLAIIRYWTRDLGGPAAREPEAFGSSGGVPGAALSLGFFLFLSWATARAFVAVPTARVEGLGVGEACAVSVQRTLGLRWKLVVAILAWAALDVGGTRVILVVTPCLSLPARMWATVAWDALVTTPLFAVLMCVVDRDLRRAALGPPAGTLERVFD